MPVIYLNHSIHGNKVAMCEQEADYDCKNGWVRYNVGTLLTPSEAAPEREYVESLDDLRARWEVKYGKKPHHKKSADTLRMELDHGDSGRPD